jgi:hypothetical protein
LHQFELLSHEKYVSPFVLACRHYSNGEYSKSPDNLEEGVELREPNVPYLAASDAGFVNLYETPGLKPW